jgi:NADH dehydrogenase
MPLEHIKARAKRPCVAIIGAGFAGLAAAKNLADADADIILIDRRNHHIFQPLLYQVATAALSPFLRLRSPRA